MKALYVKEKKLGFIEIPKPSALESEALIKVDLAGICATDLEIVKGYMDFTGVLGHEFVGVVEDCEALPEIIGKRVVGEINCGCGYCAWCRQGLARHCPDRTVLGIQGRDGAFAEYLVLPAENVHQIPDEVEDRNATFVEPLAAAFEILEQVHLKPGMPVLVIGDGRLAQLIVRVLTRAGCQVDVVGLSERKLRKMKGWISRAFMGSPPPNQKYPVVVEASGSPKGWQSAVDSVESRGTIILKSTYSGTFEYNTASLVINEITVTGSRCGPFGPAIETITSGLDLSSLVDAEYPPDQWKDAFAAANEPDTLKVLFRIGS